MSSGGRDMKYKMGQELDFGRAFGVGSLLLQTCIPLFHAVLRQNSLVQAYLEVKGKKYWSPNFRSNLYDWEINFISEYLLRLEDVVVYAFEANHIIWTKESNVVYFLFYYFNKGKLYLKQKMMTALEKHFPPKG